MKAAAVGKSFEQFGLHLPMFSTDVWTGPRARSAPLLATAIPLGIYNFTEAMNNVESASAAGDNYNLRKILLADGLGAIVGSMLGSPFPPAVYIGHPGWKAVGGRIGYSLATGVAIALVCFLGLTALLLDADPAGRDPADPALHRPGDRRAGVPGHRRRSTRRRWCWRSFPTSPSGPRRRSTARSARPARRRRQVGMGKLAGTGVLYQGMESLGGGSVLAGMVLGAMAVFIIDSKLRHAAAWAFAGAVLAFVGLIHGAQLGWAVSPLVALGYAMFGVTCLVLSRGQPDAPVARLIGRTGARAPVDGIIRRGRCWHRSRHSPSTEGDTSVERRKASDFPPEVLKLFDGYVHGWLSRRDFLDKAGKYAVGGFTAAAMLESLRPNYAFAQQVAEERRRGSRPST